MDNPVPYIPGTPPVPEPLSRYLPPIPNGVVSAWLSQHLPLKHAERPWVLDPFCASPRLAVEAARAGCHVLVAANNPVSRFLLEMTANPPAVSELKAALADLAASQRGGERLEPQMRALYASECTHCGKPVQVEAFVWEPASEDAPAAPYACLYTCPNCGAEGEHPASEADRTRAAAFASGGLHRARALERVAPANDPDRQHAEEAIATYLPRAVYGLFTLINRLDGLSLSPARRQGLQALLLHACDQANTLWDHPARRERPKQLSTPQHFRENNIWLALERGIQIWGRETAPERLPLTIWPALPADESSGSICLFEGRLKDLAAALPGIPVQAVVTALPRPNQAFWSLSALWAGWLWGHEAVGPFKSVLRRRRYDWAWHTTALYAAFKHIATNEHTPASKQPAEGLPFLGLIGEAEIGFLTAALTAADAAGFALQGLALQNQGGAAQELAQVTWVRAPGTTQPIDASQVINEAMTTAQQAILEHLHTRAEPATSLTLAAVGAGGMAQKRIFHLARLASMQTASTPDATSEAGPAAPGELYNQAHTALRESLTYRAGLLRYTNSEKAARVATPRSPAAPAESQEESTSHEIPEGGFWWLRDTNWTGLPLADQVEVALVNHLLKHPGCTRTELEGVLYTAFPGLLTPPVELIQVCLESYAETLEAGSAQLRLHPQDAPAERSQDLQNARALLARLGQKLGYRIEGSDPGAQASGKKVPLEWCEAAPGGQTLYWFYPTASAVIGEIILQGAPLQAEALGWAPRRAYIVLPGGRANLVAYKLRRDPRLARACASETNAGWRFIKFRHLRWLLENPLLSRENAEELLSLDPLTYSTPQMRLI
ncbi:MAG TPA: hypothetical protein PKM21_02060 [Anaerolineales bacterium]|nr:hypothetical protein [Anaerolineales bacterium]